MHCALNLTVTRSYRNQAYQDTHTHRKFTPQHVINHHFISRFTVWSTPRLRFYRLMEDPMLYRLQEDTTSEMSSQRAACFKKIETNLWIYDFFHDLVTFSYFRLVCLVPISWNVWNVEISLWSHRGMEGLVHGLRLASAALGRFWQWCSEMRPPKITHIKLCL